jgi:Fic family protein
MSFDPKQPYNDLPLLPPPGDLETKQVLKKCVAANKALAELKGAGDLIPNQAMLINAIPLQEAKLSSEIENIVTTQDALFQAALDESRVTDPATKEVLRYRTALKRGFKEVESKPFRLSLLEELCGVLRNEKVKFREGDAVYIGNPAARSVIYTPPAGAAVMHKKLNNLEGFLLAKDDLDPLVRMAVAHYQFEAIHPFTDGNGRTGRILNILFLIHAGLLRIPVLYLSRHLIQHKSEYRGCCSSSPAWKKRLSGPRAAFSLSGTYLTKPSRAPVPSCRPRFTQRNWWNRFSLNPTAKSNSWWMPGLPSARLLQNTFRNLKSWVF